MIQKLYYLGARAQEMHLYFHAAAFYRDICENFIRRYYENCPPLPDFGILVNPIPIMGADFAHRMTT